MIINKKILYYGYFRGAGTPYFATPDVREKDIFRKHGKKYK
jgi:hypothetical protein